jgi:hypothetical protein
MYGLQDYLVGLSRLHELTSAEERRAAWRQGMTALANAVDNRQPTPLEGLPPDTLLTSVRAALSAGLVDEMGWLSPAEATTAVLELATALPQGQEKRALGRRVLKALHEGDALTFATLARTLALGSPRALAGAPVRARVALALRLPLASVRSADGLALAILCRPELEHEWLGTPSVGVLPTRRLAARILERAAREAVRRSLEGDDSGLRAFDRPTVRSAWSRLLADRESLVWRHVAVARGFLAAIDPVRMEEVQRALSPHFGPTEWRRAATSLAAGTAHDPDAGLLRCRDLLRSEICRRHPGLAVGLVFGAARAGEEEPQAAEELLCAVVKVGDLDVMEALAEFRREQLGGEIGATAARQAVARLRATGSPTDDGVAALRDAVLEDLAVPEGSPAGTLGQQLAGGLLAFAEGRDLRPFADAALEQARLAIAELEANPDNSSEDRRRAFRALRELDLGLLEDATLGELLTVAGSDNVPETLERVVQPLGKWLLAREGQPLTGGPLPHPVARQRRLRALLHLLDSESAARETTTPARDLRLRAFRLLLARVETDVASPLRRTLCAALARAGDAIFRDELCEMSDLLVAVAAKVRAAADLQVLAEASMVPEVKELYRAAAEMAKVNAAAPPGPGDRSFLEAFQALARALPPGTSPRVEGLRRAFLDMARALEGVAAASALVDLTRPGGPFEQLEPAVQYGAQLCSGARRRLGLGGPSELPTAGQKVRALAAAVEKAVREEDDDVSPALHAALEAVRADLPVGLAEVVARGLARVAELPRERTTEFVFNNNRLSPSQSAARQPLPQWLPPSRTIGGFYIVRPIGNGAGGSVFVARRAEERSESSAESYALKVPSYSGQNAHTLSEDQFLQLFREEAGALLTLPQQQNLAGFVTFDARARPKPILVMELVHGPTLERILEKQELSVPTAFAILQGIASGLGAMHATGVGHFDVKPSNIILRDSQGSFGSKLSAIDAVAPVPVLVDFGLAGRKLRPGCASPYYGAPEVWDSRTYRLAADYTSADVYAYCCLAYELLTGRTLFDGESLPALIGNHLTHDGRPPRLQSLYVDTPLVELAEILIAGLSPDPRARPSITEMGEALRHFAPNIEDRPWPVGAA